MAALGMFGQSREQRKFCGDAGANFENFAAAGGAMKYLFCCASERRSTRSCLLGSISANLDIIYGQGRAIDAISLIASPRHVFLCHRVNAEFIPRPAAVQSVIDRHAANATRRALAQIPRNTADTALRYPQQYCPDAAGQACGAA